MSWQLIGNIAGKHGKDAEAPDIDALAAKAAALVPAPRDGRDGKDGSAGRDAPMPDLGVIAKMAAELMPRPEKGESGRDGKDIDPEFVRAEIAKAVALIPVPKDGRDGHDADPEAIRAEVAKAVSLIPVPKDGVDGRDGIDGVTLSAEDFASMKLDTTTRTLSMTFVRGDKSVTQSCSADGLMFYRDIYQDGKTYAHGDTVTWGGSLWYAKEPVSVKPGDSTTESRKWVLVAKRGAEGREGKKGDPGPAGQRGEKGERGPDRW